MRISDWSSDVCSSDLAGLHRAAEVDVDEQAQDGGEEAPHRHERLDRHLVSGHGEHEREHTDAIDASVAGEQAADASGEEVDDRHGPDDEGRRVVEDAPARDACDSWAERRVGKGCVSTSSSRWSPANKTI